MRDEPAGGGRQPGTDPREILAAGRESVEVPEGADVTASPDEGDYQRFFHRARVASFEDLQTLGLVPEGLREEDVRRAIAADDRTALDLAYAGGGSAADDCECHDDGSAEKVRPRGRTDVRRRYDAVRRHHHPELARLHSELWGSAVEWDSPVVSHTKAWASQLGRIRDLLAFAIDDLTIGKNATFNVAAGTKVLWVRDIRIHTGGRLVGNGSYLKVRCRSVQGNLA